MSNLSDIGFAVRGEQDVNEMIMQVLPLAAEIRCARGFYLQFSDASGAEIWLQGNLDQELIGFNPHFAGKSRQKVALTGALERDSSDLDGGFHAWSNPPHEDDAAGDYPFIFDVPDFRTISLSRLPQTVEIQMTAFASSDFRIFASVQDYEDGQESETKIPVKSFIPSGLYAFNEDDQSSDLNAVRPIGAFAGEIKEFDRRTNELTKESFYWLLVETAGGEADVVADAKLITTEPQIGGIVSGQFWLSARLLKD